MALGHGDALQRRRPPALGSPDRRDDAPSRTEGERAAVSRGAAPGWEGGTAEGARAGRRRPQRPGLRVVPGGRRAGRAGAAPSPCLRGASSCPPGAPAAAAAGAAGPRAGGPHTLATAPCRSRSPRLARDPRGWAPARVAPTPSARGCLRPAPPTEWGSRTRTTATAPRTSRVGPEPVTHTGPLQGPGARLWVEGSGTLVSAREHLPAPQSSGQPAADAGGGGCSPGGALWA